VDVLTITADVRERRSGVPECLAALGVMVDLVTLAVGDYAFGDRVVERKTVADLHCCLRHNRIWSQVAALRRDPRRAYLLVEGIDLDDGSVPPRALRGALLKVADNGIRILQTASRDDSALWLRVFAAQEHRRFAQRATVHVGRRPIVASPVGLLSGIPGIGLDHARALIARFGSIAAIAAASEREVQSVPGLGPARSQALLNALNHPPRAPTDSQRSSERPI
jgi:DNA excision repair protein ERCC-4